ncbi:hypothetical protein BDZ89DRAFT_1070574 [Hymenopellis radicata]|nr:hypothetical protein BDZ89DRAFT_1070574 [Hymenopellis radicata]
MAGLKNISYDDRDSSFKYAPFKWSLDGSWNASNVGRSGTLTSARDLTATLTFTFPQPANAFYYYGIPRCCGANYSICVDCYPDAPTIDALNVTDDGHNPPVVLFSQTFHDFAVHSVILKNENDSRFNKSQITVDQFVLQVRDPDAGASSTSTAFTSPSFSASQLSTSSETTAVPTSNPTSSELPTGVIAGGAVGAIAFGGFLVALFLCRRRQRHRRATATGGTGCGISEAPHPFLIGSEPTSSTSYPSKHSRTKSSPVTTVSEVIQSSSSLLGVPQHQLSRDRLPRRETDAGPVEPDADDDRDELATLPPEYEQVFHRAGSRTRTLPHPMPSSLPVSRKP